MPPKTKTNQIETPDVPQGRDNFQTPNYATELLIPFIPNPKSKIWECAAGKRKIANYLADRNYKVFASDININTVDNVTHYNFLTDIKRTDFDNSGNGSIIITNPPFSLKQKFYKRCREYNLPFALLIPCDYCGWLIEALKEGAEKIIPERRIDYITPSGLSGKTGNTANFHSMWLTWGFGLGKSETFVPLTAEMKENI